MHQKPPQCGFWCLVAVASLPLPAMQSLNSLMYLYLIYAGIYVLLFVLFGYYWRKRVHNASPVTARPKVSILIPVRNEASQLPALFANLERLTYPHLQVLFTNDFSEDNSVELLENAVAKAQARGADWQLLHSREPGKKSAQTTAVLAATGELIVSTDADCSFPPDWIERLTGPFADPKILLVAGPVMTAPMSSPVFSGFQQIEWSSILLVTQLAFGMGHPFMCSGANMAYRRATFLELKGYDGNNHLLSGDDEFLMKKILRKYGATATCYLPQAEVLVTTAAQNSWQELFTQRARWASKWTAHKTIGHVVTALVPFLMQLLFIVSPLLLWFGSMGLVVFLLFWSAKIFIENQVVGSLLVGFGIRLPFWAFVSTSILHPWYALITALRMLQADWEWKGRRQSS